MALILLLALFGCEAEEVTTACDAMCRELVQTCEYAAYPSVESCQQGCLYQEEQGADVGGQARCVVQAECDTFEVLECEHEFGAEAAE